MRMLNCTEHFTVCFTAIPHIKRQRQNMNNVKRCISTAVNSFCSDTIPQRQTCRAGLLPWLLLSFYATMSKRTVGKMACSNFCLLYIKHGIGLGQHHLYN